MYLTFLTNFCPSKQIKYETLKKNKLSFLENDNKNNYKIICKNFLVFILLWSFFLKNNNNLKLKIFFKPKKSNLITLLRAPYRHKLSRHQITIVRYYITIKFDFYFFETTNYLILKNNQIVLLLEILKKYYSFFETNLCYLHKCKFLINIFNKNNFILMNYN